MGTKSLFDIKSLLKIEYLLLFLCSIEFLGKFYSLVLLLFVVITFRQGLVRSSLSNKSFIYILFFSLFYFLFAPDVLTPVVFPVFVASFVVGYNMTDNSKALFLILLVLAVGTGLHGLLICIKNFGQFGVDGFGNRVLFDYWGDYLRGATAQSCAFLIFSGIFITLLAAGNSNFPIKLFAVLFAGAALFNAISSASRSALLYPGLVVLISYIPFLRRGKALKYILTAVFILLLLVVLYQINFLNFRSFFENQYLYQRFIEKDDGGIERNSRIGLWMRFFENIGDYTFGGTFNITDKDYVHNTLLDVYVDGGVIPFFFLTMILIRAIKLVVFLLKRVPVIEKSYILGGLMAFLLIFMTEPIIQGASWFFAMFLMYLGCLEKRRRLLLRTQ